VFACFATNSFADTSDEICEPGVVAMTALDELGEQLKVPNCARRPILLKAQKGNFSPLCSTCKEEYDSAVKRLNIPRSDRKIDLEGVALNELKKSLSANMLDIINLRTAHNIQGDFDKAIKACNVQDFKKRL